MLIHSRGNQYNDDPRARESGHLDANDVAPICPIISLCSRESICSRESTHARGNQHITNDVAPPAKWIRKPAESRVTGLHYQFLSRVIAKLMKCDCTPFHARVTDSMRTDANVHNAERKLARDSTRQNSIMVTDATLSLPFVECRNSR